MSETVTTTAPCPICFKPMVKESSSWRCEVDAATKTGCGKSFPPCPTCGKPLELQRAEPQEYWCPNGRVWFDGDLKATSQAAHLGNDAHTFDVAADGSVKVKGPEEAK